MNPDIRNTLPEADTAPHQQPLAIILMGIPAAGKSTFYAQELATRGIKHINLDTLHTRNKELLQIQEYLQNGISFANTDTLENPVFSRIGLYQSSVYLLYANCKNQQKVNILNHFDNFLLATALSMM